MDMDRQEMINQILYYVDNHRDGNKSRNICARVLGETSRARIDDEMIRELKIKLPNVKSEEIESMIDFI